MTGPVAGEAGSVGTVLYALAAWTVFVWTTRISNILEDSAATGASRALDLAVAGTLAVLGLAVAVVAWRGGRPLGPVPVGVVLALVVATVAVWGVRTPPILADPDHGVGFKAVHAALALVSVALAGGAWWTVRRRRSVPSRA
ncbi:MAG: hypothetical protein ACRDZ9_04700 [Acidimicrobiales bacterium]